MNTRQGRIFKIKFESVIILLFTLLIPNCHAVDEGSKVNNLVPKIELCEEIKIFENQNFSIFDEIKKNSATDGISILIMNKDCVISERLRSFLNEKQFFSGNLKYTCFCERSDMDNMVIKLIKNSKIFKEFKLNSNNVEKSENYDSDDRISSEENSNKFSSFISLKSKLHKQSGISISTSNSSDPDNGSNSKINLELTQNNFNFRRDRLFDEDKIDIHQLKQDRMKRTILVSIIVFAVSVLLIVVIKSALDCVKISFLNVYII